MSVRNVTFTKQPFWIQVWGLSFDLINEEAGSDIGRSIGELVEVDCKAINSDQSRFLRIRVKVPLNKWLRRGGPVISPEGEVVRVAFRYERLVGWCFSCGRIGHTHSDCPIRGSAVESEKPYGEWLKAGIRARNTQPNKDSHTRRTHKPSNVAPPTSEIEMPPRTRYRKISSSNHNQC